MVFLMNFFSIYFFHFTTLLTLRIHNTKAKIKKIDVKRRKAIFPGNVTDGLL